ncbi:MAG TPA: NGG1p interacting factor NIF3 [Candidatus Pacearchaeota archaeon]|nr:NGG1p interacting factor NIF3 [Tissierellia bacterium]HOI59706.1 NGG1p interacting factor NIF3 [Candidatus Pacearchaeota archaeon]
MSIKEIFDLAIQLGIEADFRGKDHIQKYLKKRKEKYDSLSLDKKELFDVEAFQNPYMDSRIYNIAEDKDIKKVLSGIDIEGEELLLADKMEGIDLVIGHHPEGKGLAWLSDVMDIQIDILSYYGIPINQAEKVTRERISEVARSVNAANHNRAVDMAKLLNINFMNVHSPADNLAADFIKKEIESKHPEYLCDIIKIFENIPEYREAIKIGAGPKIFVGGDENRCGKIAVTEIAGGTEGSEKMYEKMAQAGIGTIIGMHMSERNKKEAEANNINVVIAGHISSDSLGMNLFLDELEKKGIEVIPCSGLTRIKRF